MKHYDEIRGERAIWEFHDGILSLHLPDYSQQWTASHWDIDDFTEFMSNGHDRIANAEMMEQLPPVNRCPACGQTADALDRRTLAAFSTVTVCHVCCKVVG